MKLAMLLVSVLSLATAGAEVSEDSACVDEGAPWKPNLCSELKKQTPKQIKKSCKKSTQGGAFLKYCKLTCGKCSPPTPTGPVPPPLPPPAPPPTPSLEPTPVSPPVPPPVPPPTPPTPSLEPSPKPSPEPSPTPSPEPSPGPSCEDLDDAMKGGKNKCKLAEKCMKAKDESGCKIKLCERDGCKKWNKKEGECKKEGKKRCSKTCCELSEGSSPTKKCENTCEKLYKICKLPCPIVGKKCDKACSKAKKLCDTACRLE